MEKSNVTGKSSAIRKRRRKNNIIKIAVVIIILLVLIVAIFIMIGKKTFPTTESAIYVNNKEEILCASIEKLDKDYYQSEDLKKYIEEQISLYHLTKKDKEVKMTSFKQEGKTIKLFMKYADSKVYEKFNGQELFAGTLKEAQEKGYEIPKKAPKGDELKIVIMQEKMGIKVAGKIVYFSKNVKKVDDSTVTMKDKDDQETNLIIVIYK